MCTTATLNPTILGGEWGYDKMVLIFDWKCVNDDVRLQGGRNVVSHIARGVDEEEPYMEGFHNTLSMPFLEGVGLIKK